MEQYKTDAEIYAVLEREIIDLTIRPGLSLIHISEPTRRS